MKLEDILSEHGRRIFKGNFKVHSEHLTEIMEFVKKHGYKTQNALYAENYSPAVDRYWMALPYKYLLSTKYGPIEVTYECEYGGTPKSAKIEYEYTTPEEQEEIKKLFHEENMTEELKEKAEK